METKTITPEPTTVDLRDWKAKAAEGDEPEKGCIRKAFEAEVKLPTDDGDRSVEFIISTSNPDRERDIVVPRGGDWTAYLRGGPGPVQFAHDYHQLPVAHCSDIRATDTTLIGRASFPTNEELGVPEGQASFSEMVFRMVRNRLGLKSASIGFAPSKWNFDEERKGFDFLEWEGLEWSIVPIPANGDAIAQMSAEGIDTGPLRAWAEKALSYCGELAVVERAKLEAVATAVGDERGRKIFDLGAADLQKAIEDKALELLDSDDAPTKGVEPDDGRTDQTTEYPVVVHAAALDAITSRIAALEKRLEGEDDPASGNGANQKWLDGDDLALALFNDSEILQAISSGAKEAADRKHIRTTGRLPEDWSR